MCTWLTSEGRPSPGVRQRAWASLSGGRRGNMAGFLTDISDLTGERLPLASYYIDMFFFGNNLLLAPQMANETWPGDPLALYLTFPLL